MKNDVIEGFRFSRFSNMLYGKKGKPEMPEINRKFSKLKEHPVLTVDVTRKLLKSNLFITYLFLNILHSNVDFE